MTAKLYYLSPWRRVVDEARELRGAALEQHEIVVRHERWKREQRIKLGLAVLFIAAGLWLALWAWPVM